MCGIAGIVSLSRDAHVDAGELRTMAGQLVHRGPDDEGFYLDPDARCGLAFRRLAIIDLNTGNQPIGNETNDVHVVFNGEIYNFRELRRELESAGHRFRTRGDAETIVHAYEEHGRELCRRIAGMFAIAVWDERRGELLLTRDRFGKKPLVYAIHEKRLYFASEAKAILALPGVPRDLDPQSLHRYLVFQYVPAPHSIYHGFRKILPGHVLRVGSGRPLAESQEPYWRVPAPNEARQKQTHLDYDGAKAELGRACTRAVERRLTADVPLGAFLSGGIDSSIVVGLMRKLGVSPLRTFSIGFADRRYDETDHARAVAARFGTEHHEHMVTPRAREVLDTLAHHFDEPFADSSAIPTYYVSRYTREHVTVALTGDGGDESFMGYDRYVAARLAARFDWLPRPLRAAIASAGRVLPSGEVKTRSSRLRRFLEPLGGRAVDRYLAWVNIFTPAQLADGYHPDFAARIDFDEPLRWFRAAHHSVRGRSPARANYTDFISYLPYDLLAKVDIASMACSLECRCPLLDHELVEFAMRLPPAWRLGRRGKHILKDWAADLLPPTILKRPKMGFGVPIGEWFRNELRELLRDRLTRPESIARRVFRPEWLDRLLDAHLSGRANHAHRLWALFVLELWQDRWQPTNL